MGGCALAMEVAPADFEGMKIVCRSWRKTFANLHDYTADKELVSVRLFNLVEDTRIFKFGNKYEFSPFAERESNQAVEGASDGIIDVLQNREKKRIGEGITYFVSGRIFKQKQQPWIVAKSLPYKGYVLKEGDILRIGKQKVRVKELMEREEVQNQDQQITAKGLIYHDLTKEGEPSDLPEEEIKTLTCRYCFDEAELGNPLISPCKCIGSSKYVHLSCNQKWLIKTINPRPIGKATAITWKPLHCQLCNQTLPFKVYLDGKGYFIVNMSDLKPPRPYVILNPIYRSKDLGKSKIYMMVSFSEQKEMMIGRKSDTDIIISSDSTVGRQNSKIVYEAAKGEKPGRFVLYDNESKFGTLVLLRRSFHMVHEINGICLQFGGDVLQFKVGNKSKSQGDVDVEDPVNKIRDVQESEEDDEEGHEMPNREHEHEPEQEHSHVPVP